MGLTRIRGITIIPLIQTVHSVLMGFSFLLCPDDPAWACTQGVQTREDLSILPRVVYVLRITACSRLTIFRQPIR